MIFVNTDINQNKKTFGKQVGSNW